MARSCALAFAWYLPEHVSHHASQHLTCPRVALHAPGAALDDTLHEFVGLLSAVGDVGWNALRSCDCPESKV
jgi:hypothetical protein